MFAKETRSRPLGIALTAILSTVFVAYSLLSSFSLGYITHGVDTFIIRSLVFVILVTLIRGFGYSTMMGGISGFVLEFTIPSPIRFYLLPSVFAYGLVFDLVINFLRSPGTNLTSTRILFATILASATMSSVALTVFTLVGFFPLPLLPIIWGLEMATDIAMGIIGATIGLLISRQLQHLKP